MRGLLFEDRVTRFGNIDIAGPREGRFEDFVQRALEAVPDSVGIDRLPVSIAHEPGLSANATFSIDGSISVRVDTRTPTLSVAHELGHAVDYFALGDGEFASDQGIEELRDLFRAIEQTRLYSKMTQDHENARLLMRDEERELRRLLTPRELFARAFAQWVATEAQDELLLRELAFRQEPKRGGMVDDSPRAEYRDHWTDADFAPVREALNRLFA